MPFILSLDQGTTSSRAIVFNESGMIRSIAHKEFRQIFPRPGWVEHDGNEIWASQAGVAAEAMARAGLTAADIACIGITNQRETTLVWERQSGRPLSNAIVWQDRRTAPLCERLKAQGVEPLFRERTGLVLDPYFSGTKLAWILDSDPLIRKRAIAGELAFGTIDSWLLWNLTGGAVHATDATNASRTLLCDIRRCAWDEELLDILDIPLAMLPEIRGSSEPYGETASGLFARPIPITGMAGDQQAALFGQSCTQPGMIKNTYGTGCFMLMQTGDRLVHSRNNLVSTIACRVGDRIEYALEGSVFVAGAAVQWLRDGLGIIRSSADVESLAASVPDNGGVYLVPAFTGLGAPHWDPYARGTIVGLTRGTTAAHIARATLESIAFQSADLVAAMEDDAGIRLSELRVDGGATANDLLMQFQADLLGAPVVRPEVKETTALGAAFLAGLAQGVWRNRQEIAEQWRTERTFFPSPDRDHISEMCSRWERALTRSAKWEMPETQDKGGGF